MTSGDIRACTPPSLKGLGVLLYLTLIVGAVEGQTVIHVDQHAAGRNDGTSWIDALSDLQDALAVAQFGDQVWIAAGRYTPDRGTGDRTTVFRVPDGVRLYGGFFGDEECLDERDWIVNVTSLSGDLAGDDGPRDCDLYTDCCREHEGNTCDNAECQARVCAAYPYCCDERSSSWDRTCTVIAERECCDVGSWQSCENSYIVIDVSDTSTATGFDGLLLTGAYINYAESFDILGGIVILADRAGPAFRNVTFGEDSFRTLFGRQAYGIQITNSDFLATHNDALEVREGSVTVADCRIAPGGAGWIVDSGVLTVTNTDFAGGGRRDRPFLTTKIYPKNTRMVVRECTFHDSRSGAINLNGGSVLIENCDFIANGRDVTCGHTSLTIRNCRIVDPGGAYMSLNACNVLIENSLLLGSESRSTGAIYASEGLLNIVNSAIVGYHAEGSNGGGLFLDWGHTTVTNSIFLDNRSVDGADVREGELGSFYFSNGATLDINHSIVDGWTGLLGGVGNSGNDPLFVDADGADDIRGTEDDDLRLSPDSPAINAGDPDFGEGKDPLCPPTGEGKVELCPSPETDKVELCPPRDLDGHARILCGRVDIGPYEFGIGDYDCNQAVELTDFAHWAQCMTDPVMTALAGEPPVAPAGCEAFDFNADGAVDLRDFAAFQLACLNP